jgi:hypothetical protein
MIVALCPLPPVRDSAIRADLVHSIGQHEVVSNGRPVRRLAAALTVAVYACVVLGVGLLTFVRLEWDARSDPARCTAVAEATRAEVDLGGWAEPDRCRYFNQRGVQIPTDGDLAAPAERTESDLLPPSLLMSLLATGIVGAVVMWRRRRVRAPRLAARSAS